MGNLANDYLEAKLAPPGHYEIPHIPGLCKHISRYVEFTLVVENFKVKYVGEKNIQHPIQTLKKDFITSEDSTRSFVLWNDVEVGLRKTNSGFLNTRIHQQGNREVQHEIPQRPQRLPYPVAPTKYGKGAQDPI